MWIRGGGADGVCHLALNWWGYRVQSHFKIIAIDRACETFFFCNTCMATMATYYYPAAATKYSYPYSRGVHDNIVDCRVACYRYRYSSSTAVLEYWIPVLNIEWMMNIAILHGCAPSFRQRCWIQWYTYSVAATRLNYIYAIPVWSIPVQVGNTRVHVDVHGYRYSSSSYWIPTNNYCGIAIGIAILVSISILQYCNPWQYGRNIIPGIIKTTLPGIAILQYMAYLRVILGLHKSGSARSVAW